MRKLKNDELGRISPDEFKKSSKSPIVIILDNVRSLNNIGSVFRTADAFRVKKIFLCGITATPPHRDINKTALGATESVEWEYFREPAEVVARLKETGYSVYALEQADRSISLKTFDISGHQKIGLVFGNEVRGVSEEVIRIADGCIEIPQFGTKHSFNISVSVGIVVWEIFHKMNIVFGH